MDSSLAKVYSRAEDYPETAKRALAEMVRQTGEAVFDENGLMKKGVIVRHLLLPGAVKNAKGVVKYMIMSTIVACRLDSEKKLKEYIAD